MRVNRSDCRWTEGTSFERCAERGCLNGSMGMATTAIHRTQMLAIASAARVKATLLVANLGERWSHKRQTENGQQQDGQGFTQCFDSSTDS